MTHDCADFSLKIETVMIQLSVWPVIAGILEIGYRICGASLLRGHVWIRRAQVARFHHPAGLRTLKLGCAGQV